VGLGENAEGEILAGAWADSRRDLRFETPPPSPFFSSKALSPLGLAIDLFPQLPENKEDGSQNPQNERVTCAFSCFADIRQKCAGRATAKSSVSPEMSMTNRRK
jgi:hypothetical protein